uniref:Oxygen-evolving enhancer protein 1, chloroplastic n=1 Tax=Chattonella marina var. antiqua TaxID=859642 RepID=PSBO_CHAMQ|nr:RecName: Full=Oxygen-evolving enhancer protein 1, chloroplastic; Short=OEE1; Flags: Precursor [Chattonella marina var. antiqua]BBL54382.1 oxygen-evolving enhancer [Chattonella marina var. antiqua]
MKAVIAVFITLMLTAVVAFQPAASFSAPKCAGKMSMAIEDAPKKAAAAALAALTTLSVISPSFAITKEELRSLDYLQVKGTGLANRCPEVKGTDSIKVKGAGQEIVDLCIEPKTFQVLEETRNKKGELSKEFINTKLMTRQTYTLDGISGDLNVVDGKIQFTELDGIDYAATTVQKPGGERVPFLFTVKELVAKASAGGNTIAPGFQMGGKFVVPSYRTGLFLDPKGRGATTGYDMAVALPGIQSGVEGDEELFRENNKVFDVLSGQIEFEVNRVNLEEGEIGGVFVSTQGSDTDMGSKSPETVLLKGIFYGRIADKE